MTRSRTRRQMLIGASTGLMFGGMPLPALSRARAGDAVGTWPLWEGAPPGGGGPTGPEQVSAHGAITNVSTPTLTIWRPERPNGAAMLVAGGGGYQRIQMQKEAEAAARWLIGLGVTAFTLAYRLPMEGWGAGRLAPFQDAQRAVRMMRHSAPALGLDPHRIGGVGFSAGGHLLGMTSARSHEAIYASADAIDVASSALDLNLLLYPIVTLKPPYDRTSTRRVLIGAHPTPEDSAMWSLETHIHRGLRPFFLAQAADDQISNPANTAILELACHQTSISAARHLFPTGGHGFGMGIPGTETIMWPGLAENWMRKTGFIA
ncbi:alpha/beta hydrolase [Acetobacter sacchari]